MRKWSIWGPLQNPVGAKMRSKIDPVAPQTFHFHLYADAVFPTRETLKHRETPSGLDLRFVYDFRCFTFFNLSGSVVTKYMICLVFVTAPKTLRNASRIDPSKPSGRQNGIQNQASGAKMEPFSQRLSSQNVFLKTHRFVYAFWSPFGSLLVPLGFRLIPLCFTLGIIFHVSPCL